MPRSRLSSSEIVAIQARLVAGESVSAIAASLGRSRQTLSRIKGGLDRGQVRWLSVKLNIRVTEARGLTVSEAARHLVRQASDLLAIAAVRQPPLSGVSSLA